MMMLMITHMLASVQREQQSGVRAHQVGGSSVLNPARFQKSEGAGSKACKFSRGWGKKAQPHAEDCPTEAPRFAPRVAHQVSERFDDCAQPHA
mmetsp:Transcript_4202/g.10641  ORF Transcript_4202/g.10641 Transcript_4202/m.10641 type:complete len:93 (+) Transcript_4202:6-284(+)